MQIDNYNSAQPTIMHIDLNSCFATVEQQARPVLRGRPVAVVNRRTEHTMIVTASYEAKARGVTLGMRLRDAKKICPELIGVESDPPKYRYVYHQLMRIMNDYSAHVRMKSIDEGVIDFSDTTTVIAGRSLTDIAIEIKQRLRDEVGCAMRCNVGIATNRFLAKTAAGLHKPDGLDEITHENLRQILCGLELTDITGIAGRMESRLNAVGIFTTAQLLDASEETLRRLVWRSVDGTAWYRRLRGWEVDKRDFPMRTAGRQYVLDQYNMPREEVMRRLFHLSEAVGRKIRSQGLVARGVRVHARHYRQSGSGWRPGFWHARQMMNVPFFSDQAIYRVAARLIEEAPWPLKEIGVTCYELSHQGDHQLSLWDDELIREQAATVAVDDINTRYGERTIHHAESLGTDMMKSKIPFGSTRYL